MSIFLDSQQSTILYNSFLITVEFSIIFDGEGANGEVTLHHKKAVR